MATHTLTEKLHGDVHHALVMGSAFAGSIDWLTMELLQLVGRGEAADHVMAIMGTSRHLATSLQEAADKLEAREMEELPGEEASHG